MATIRAFFTNSGHFFQFSKKDRGDLPPSSPILALGRDYSLTMKIRLTLYMPLIVFNSLNALFLFSQPITMVLFVYSFSRFFIIHKRGLFLKCSEDSPS